MNPKRIRQPLTLRPFEVQVAGLQMPFSVWAVSRQAVYVAVTTEIGDRQILKCKAMRHNGRVSP